MQIIMSIEEESPGVVRTQAVGNGQASAFEAVYVEAITLAVHRAIEAVENMESLEPSSVQIVFTENRR